MSSASAADSPSAAATLPVAVVLQLPRQQRLRGEGRGSKTLYCKVPSPKDGMLWICAPLLASSAGFQTLPCAALHRKLYPLGLGRVILSFCRGQFCGLGAAAPAPALRRKPRAAAAPAAAGTAVSAVRRRVAPGSGHCFVPGASHPSPPRRTSLHNPGSAPVQSRSGVSRCFLR